MFGKVQNIHFVGIGGIGMSGIAEVLINLGFSVSGSDVKSGPVTERLSHLGAKIRIGHDASCVAEAHVVVVSSAVKPDNPEVLAAHEAKVPVIPRGEMLAELMRMKEGIAVAGSHGKTTTTSMIAHILSDGGLDPTIVVGGKLGILGSNAKLGKGPTLVAEADESDGSFLLLSPTFAVVTNIDREHLDHYKDLGEIKEAFVAFANKVPFYGCALVCMDCPSVASIRPQLRRQVRTYGTTPQVDIQARNIKQDGTRTYFDVRAFGQDLGAFALNVPGRHMVLNALAAIGMGLEMGVEAQAIRTSLKEFSGAERRFTFKGERQGVMVVDDYGHHPTEIAATLAGARAGFPDRRIVVAFQPHRYTRTKALMDEFASAFFEADVVVISDIYPASEAPIPGLTGQTLVDALRSVGQRGVHYVPEIHDMPKALAKLTQPKDMLITFGAGSITQVGPAFLAL
ncbi:MAG: UDP-N-acetylmuramate--L-alanine ligase [Holophagales bacterium]|jgi:UDP-N-acetylmuramate--alanine ligase|nr:UDP-N-acetylmuramate--L-alanine ligase [Holophagales bacterium]